MKKTSLLFITLILTMGMSYGDITFTGDVSVDFNENSLVYNDVNGQNDVYRPSGINSTGWDMLRAFFHFDRTLDRLYVGLDFNTRICGDADGNGNPSTTGSTLAGYGGTDVADLGIGETVCVYFNTNMSGGYDVIAGVPRYGAYANFTVSNCLNNPNYDPSNSFGTAIASASASVLYMSPDAAHPDFEFYIDNFSELPGFDFDPASEECIFGVGAYTGSWSDDGIGYDILSSSQKTITFYAQLTIPHTVPRDLYVMQGIPLVVDNGDPTVLFGDDLLSSPIGWPYWRVSRWNVGYQTYERWGEENWPVQVGGNPPEQDPGRGFWFVQDLLDDCELDITGTPLEPGWIVFQPLDGPMTGGRRGLNQMATPFHVSVDWETAYLRDDPYGGPAEQIEDAVNAGRMCRYAVTWEPFNREYITNDYDVALEPWQGFWVEQYRQDYDYSLCFNFPSQTDNANKNRTLGGSVPREIDEYGEWSFSIGVYSESNQLIDMGNFIGISADASDNFDQFDAPEFAPQFTPDGAYYHLYFPHYDWTTNPGGYCYDFRQGPFEGIKTWDLIVHSDLYTGTLIMAWDGVFKSHPEYQVSLLDDAGNMLVEDLLQAENYTFSISSGEFKEFSLRVTGFGSAVEPETPSSLTGYRLSAAYPNPFNNNCKLSFSLPSSGNALLQVFDVEGRLAATLADGEYAAGEHSVTFNGRNLASGIYFLRASTDGEVFGSQKLVLVK